MANLVIFGTGVVARLAHFYFQRDSPHTVVAFAVDKEYLTSDRFEDLPVVPSDRLLESYPPSEFQMFVAMGYQGMNRPRVAVYERLLAMGYELVSYVSSKCTYLSDSLPGKNCFILEDNTIQPFVKIGNNVVLWSGNHVGHDAVIEDHCFITGHVIISGFTRIGQRTFIGVNSTIRNDVTIGPDCLISAGSIIYRDTPAGSVYYPQRARKHPKGSQEIKL